jgi:hypothetical protein
VHADAPTVEQTDWSQIVALYDHLLAVAPTPVVALNRAIAIGELQGPLLRWRWWRSWTWTATTRSTPHEPICFDGWAGTAKLRPPTSVGPPGAHGRRTGLPQTRWPSLALSGPVTSSKWPAQPHTERRSFAPGE